MILNFLMNFFAGKFDKIWMVYYIYYICNLFGIYMDEIKI